MSGYVRRDLSLESTSDYTETCAVAWQGQERPCLDELRVACVAKEYAMKLFVCTNGGSGSLFERSHDSWAIAEPMSLCQLPNRSAAGTCSRARREK